MTTPPENLISERARLLASDIFTYCKVHKPNEFTLGEIAFYHLTDITREMAAKVKELDRLWHEAKAEALTQREMAQIYGEQRDELTIENASLRAELEAIKKGME